MNKIVYALLGLVAILLIGTAGFMVIESWAFEDALFMTVITVTTVGYREMHDLSSLGRYFTMALILVSFGGVAYLATQLVQFVVQGELYQLFGERKMRQKIAALRNHYIVCGYGRIGETVCQELAQQQLPLVVLEKDADLAERARGKRLLMLQGDALSDEALIDAGIRHAGCLISVVSRDADNLLITLSARELNHKIRLIARGEGPGMETKLMRAGADIVVSPFRLTGQRIADLVRNGDAHGAAAPATALAQNVAGYHLVHVRAENHEITVAQAVESAHAVRAAALIRKNGERIDLPPKDTVVAVEDQLVLLAYDEPLVDDQEAAGKEAARILLADDHVALRRVFVKKLNRAGYDCTGVEDGAAAIAVLENEVPDLVVLDAMMPKADGFAVIRHMRADERLKAVPVILFSASNMADLKKRGEDAGADAVLEKTAGGDDLVETIARLLKRTDERSPL